MEEELIYQAPVANSVSGKIPYEMRDFFLVKPLDPIMVQKEFSKPVSNKAAEADSNGIEAVDYDTVETEVKEVESDYKKGVVLKAPYLSTVYEDSSYKEMPIEIGDVVIYRSRSAMWFDILKDTQLVKIYDIVAKEQVKHDN